MQTNPTLFDNTSIGDFHLQSGSPAINAGTDVGLTSDYTGTSVPQGNAPDIGTYEYTQSTPPTVSLTAPTNSATVSGSAVSLSATASATSPAAVAGVQFKLDTNTNVGAEDTSSPYSVTWDSTGVADGSHTLIAVSRDTYGNYATSSVATITVDNTAPVRSAGSPSSTLALNTTNTTLSLTTNEAATCKFSTSSGTAYGSMTTFTTTGSTSHSKSISGLTNGGSYIYYVKCQDVVGNTNSGDYTISFTVAADTTAPTVTMTAPSNNATVSGSAVPVTASASDDVSVAGVQFKLDTNTNIGSEDISAPYAVTWDSTAVTDGTHTIVAVARDGTGNYATSSAVTVTVDNTAPVRSAGSPSGALLPYTSTATLSLSTNETATCKYSTSSGTAYGSMTAFTTTDGTSHATPVAGLSNGMPYIYYIKCQDGQGNTNSDEYSISFSVANPPGGGGVFGSGPLSIGYVNTNPIQTPIVVTTPLLPANPPTASHKGITLMKNHKIWDKGEDIRALQQWLNANGFTIATTGPGSPGNETTTFGKATLAALKKFQKAHGLPAIGYLGPLTRKAIAAD